MCSSYVCQPGMSDIAKAEQINRCKKPGSIARAVIQANGRLTFEDDLRSGGLLSFSTQ